MSTGRLAERRFVRQQVASREPPSAWSKPRSNYGGLVGYGAGFPLWLRKTVRVASVGKAAVNSALTWSAKGRAAG